MMPSMRRPVVRLRRGAVRAVALASLASAGLAGCARRPADTGAAGEAGLIRIAVDPQCRRTIRGIGEVRREMYFGLCDHGTDFDRRCKSPDRYDDLVHSNRITFGRNLGVVSGLDRWYKAIREDPARPGFVDEAFLIQRLAARRSEPGERFARDFGGRLDVAAHESPNAFPPFMGEHATEAASREAKPQGLPDHLAAAARLTALTLRHRFTDFDRPAFFEPINEPHWSYWRGDHLARWHTETMNAVHREIPGVKVGGPCMSVAYFYRDHYKAFDGWKTFIEATGCALDFYSFHVYDFLRERNGGFGGRITGGLPLESVLDLVQNHTVNAYGKEIGVVVSEHGGYGALDLVDKLASTHFSGSGFEWEMKKRSICDFNMVSSVIANTLTFMDHPHTVLKAVPFILLDAMGWDPEYYSVLFVPRGFTDTSDWVPTQRILFYSFFRDLTGHRVRASCPDPDIQTRAFVDGDTVTVILNNLSDRPKTAALDLPRPTRATVRRLGRNPDFTPYLTEATGKSVPLLSIAPREAIAIRAAYDRVIEPRKTIDEIPLYGDRIAAPVDGEAVFTIRADPALRPRTATLRIGVSRPSDAGHDITVTFNGEPIEMPLEGCADRLVDEGREYASCKIIDLDPARIREINEVRVAFPDGRPGAVGAVVLRAGYAAPRRSKPE